MSEHFETEETKATWDGSLSSRERAIYDVLAELNRAELGFPGMASAHEGISILKEEVEELWDHVKVKQKNRDIPAMRAEAVQVAAMALRFIKDICESDGSGYKK